MTPKVRQAIFDFVYVNLPNEFDDKVYWVNERKDEPQKPFCVLQAIVPEQQDSRATEIEIENNVNKLIMFKNCVVTVSIYVDGLTDIHDLDEQNAFAYTQASTLANKFELLDTAYEFSENDISINNVSALRDLTTTVSGGYSYRYEFDVTFGYNEEMLISKEFGKDVNLQIERKLND